jgi:DUF1009 family protein
MDLDESRRGLVPIMALRRAATRAGKGMFRNAQARLGVIRGNGAMPICRLKAFAQSHEIFFSVATCNQGYNTICFFVYGITLGRIAYLIKNM